MNYGSGRTSDDYLNQRMSNLGMNDYQEGMYSSMPGPSNLYEQPGDSGNWDYQTNEATRNPDVVVADLTPEEVRWFYKTEAEKRWAEFSGYDSYRIEMRFREMVNKTGYSSQQYSSYSAFSDSSGSMGGAFGSSSIRFPGKSGAPTSQQYHDTTGQHKIVVRGGLYDVNFDTWQCASIYWPGEECAITRGTWFYDSWQPLERDQSNVLENKHLSLFKGRKMSDYAECEAKGTVLHTETFPDCFVEWFSPGQIYLYSENKPSKIVRSVTSRLGFHKSTGYRLFRGYKTQAMLDDRPDVEITHLVFVIHGIGQKMDTGRIIRNTSSLRDCVSWLRQKYFTNFPHHRAEFFPVEWRSNLQLDGELVDAITPNTLQSLRQMLNASAMDIMYYTSPLYGGEVQRGLREELNRLYSMFSARNPYFSNKGGKISVIAHSLGCVILYDIIMGLKPGSLMHNAQQGLLFQIDNFFCLGSPLAVFLALRWKDSQIPGKISSILPARLCHRLYNVFHPTDPVAYRIEPLLVKDYYRIAPLMIQPYNSTMRIPYGEMPLELQGPENQSDNTSGQQSTVIGQPISPGRDRSWTLWGMNLNSRRQRPSLDGSFLDSLEGLDYRLDYILRESSMGVSYLSALTSHTAYWTNYDIAYFILTQIFPEMEMGASGIQPDPLDRPPMEQWGYNEYEQPLNESTFNPMYGASNQPFGTTNQTPGPSNQSQPFQSSYNQPGSSQFMAQSGLRQPGHMPTTQPNFNQPGQPHSSTMPPSFNQPTSAQSHGMQPKPFDMHQPYNQQSNPNQPHMHPQTNQHQPNMQQQQTSHSQNQGMHQQPMGMGQQGVVGNQQLRNQQQPQQKLGFFDRAAGAMDLKHGQVQQQQQHASSPTKTKSFFPSFNLSSLTSPVKNLSNSLSNISNQMTNIATNAQNQPQGNQLQHQQTQQHPQQQQRGGFLGGMMQKGPNFGGQQNQQFQNQQGFDHTMGGQQSYGPQQTGQQQHPQTHYSQAQAAQSTYSPDQHGYSPGPGHHLQLGPRSNSPFNQPRSASPQSMQARGVQPGGLLQFGPLETPTGAIKPKLSHMQQPKVPTAFQQADMLGGARGRSVSPLGQSKVVCSRGSMPGSLPTSLGVTPSYGALGNRSLSSGNLRNSSVVAGGVSTGYSSYTARNTMYSASSPTTSLSSSLSRRTMSRPNLSSGSSTSGSSSALGMSSLVYNSGISNPGYSSTFGTKSYLNREYSGPSSR